MQNRNAGVQPFDRLNECLYEFSVARLLLARRRRRWLGESSSTSSKIPCCNLLNSKPFAVIPLPNANCHPTPAFGNPFGKPVCRLARSPLPITGSFLFRGFNFPAHRNLRVSEGVENLLG